MWTHRPTPQRLADSIILPFLIVVLVLSGYWVGYTIGLQKGLKLNPLTYDSTNVTIQKGPPPK